MCVKVRGQFCRIGPVYLPCATPGRIKYKFSVLYSESLHLLRCSDVSAAVFLLLLYSVFLINTFLPCCLVAWIIFLLSPPSSEKSSKIIQSFQLISLCSSLLLSALVIYCRAEDCIHFSNSGWFPAHHLAHIRVYINCWSNLVKYLVGIYVFNKLNAVQVKGLMWWGCVWE